MSPVTYDLVTCNACAEKPPIEASPRWYSARPCQRPCVGCGIIMQHLEHWTRATFCCGACKQRAYRDRKRRRARGESL